VLTLDFGDAYSIDGLTLRFSPFTGDYASSIHVAFNGSGGLIQEDDYTPDAAEYTIQEAVEDFTQIVITFNTTNRPYRYLRLQAVDYGDVIEFTDADIQEAQLVEELSPLSTELPSNTLEFTIYSESETFTPFNTDALPVTRTPVYVYETRDDVELFMGKFFLQSWKNISERRIQFQCVDYIGLMDDLTCYGGIWPGGGEPIQDILTTFLGAEGIPFELDAALYDLEPRGWLPAGTLRETLHAIGFACGAVVNCARAHTVRVYPLWHFDPYAVVDSRTHITVADSAQGGEQGLELNSAIQVELTRILYNVSSAEQVTLLDDSLGAGTYTKIFAQPLHDLAISGATITASGPNYATFTVAAPGTVTLTGYTYTQYRFLDTWGTSGQLMQIDEATLDCNDLGDASAMGVEYLLYNYFNRRYSQTARIYAPRVEPGQSVLIDSWYESQLNAVIEKMSIDLARGMVTDIEVRGNQVTA
jgi:hypothetical protein